MKVRQPYSVDAFSQWVATTVFRERVVFEHPPARDNCASCHDAHGSNNRSMLLTKGAFQCTQCHSSNRVITPSIFMSGKYAYYGTGFSLAPRGGLWSPSEDSPPRHAVRRWRHARAIGGQRDGVAQRLLQVVDQVAAILYTHAQAQQVRRRGRARAFDAGTV